MSGGGPSWDDINEVERQIREQQEHERLLREQHELQMGSFAKRSNVNGRRKHGYGYSVLSRKSAKTPGGNRLISLFGA